MEKSTLTQRDSGVQGPLTAHTGVVTDVTLPLPRMIVGINANPLPLPSCITAAELHAKSSDSFRPTHPHILLILVI